MNGMQVYKNNSNRHLRAALALIEHRSISEAARACKISRTTLWKYLRDEQFLDILRVTQAQAANVALARISGAVDEAAAVLLATLHSATASDAVKVTAARAIIMLAMRTQVGPDEELALLRRTERALSRRDGDR